MSFTVKCPKCSMSLKATPKHIGRRAKCPNCGATVAIAQQSESASSPPTPNTAEPKPAIPPVPPLDTTSAPPRPKKSYSLMVLLGSAVVALLIGYYAGREHIKYQMRSAMTEAGKALTKGLQEAFSGNIDTESKERANEKSDAFDKQPPLDFGYVHHADAFSIALIDVRIDCAEITTTFGEGISETDDKYLLCTFRVINTDKRKILTFRDTNTFIPSHFMLHDDVKNRIRGVDFGFGNNLVGRLSSTDDVHPGEQRTHLEIFTVPPTKTQHLILTVNLNAFGGDGRMKFKILSSQIKAFSGGGT